MEATATEVLFGGAAGGGKSHGQLLDAFIYAMKHAGSKQLILRRTYADLDKSLIRSAQALYPRQFFTYNGSSHTGRFVNGSVIDFGYCATEGDVFQYQSAEYDVIRFDELTHFTEFQYVYLISRLRGVNNFPKQVKSSTNPGNVGHAWVKARFIDPAPPETLIETPSGTRIFIPSKVDDNKYLMESDPEYKKRLMALPEAQRRALLEGDWNIFEGQYFSEFRQDVHVIDPFLIPKEWRRYRAFDYGLDRFACLWCAVSSDRDVFVYKELCESDLIISEAAKKANAMNEEGEDIYATFAPPDMWTRTPESGKSKADMFIDAGMRITKASNAREEGWLAIKELMKIGADGRARIHIFSNCRELIKCLPLLQIDPKRPTDCMTEPHEITHAPDALRYFAVQWTRPAAIIEERPRRQWTADMWQDYYSARSEAEKQRIKERYGEPL
ncbi:MAG: terminase family protein [Clostridia bacterium]|nr:terminase family protein [Clostridia bacterium]